MPKLNEGITQMIIRTEAELRVLKANDLHLLLRAFTKEIANRKIDGAEETELTKLNNQRGLIIAELAKRPSHGT